MNLWLVCVSVVLAIVVYYIQRIFFSKPLRSLIVLFKTPTILEPEQLRQAGEKTGVQVIANQVNDKFVFIVDQTPLEFTQVQDYYGAPRISIERAAKMVREQRAKQAVLEHTSYLTIQALVETDEQNWDQTISSLGKVLAECLDDEATLLWRADTNETLLLTPETREKMASGNLADAFRYYQGDEVIALQANDPRLLATIEEARTRWPEFVEAFHRLKDPEKTIIKAPIQEGEQTEYVWFQVESIGDSEVCAQLLSQPMNIRNCKQGDIVSVPIAGIQDWAYIEGDSAVGHFSSKVF